MGLILSKHKNSKDIFLTIVKKPDLRSLIISPRNLRFQASWRETHSVSFHGKSTIVSIYNVMLLDTLTELAVEWR